MTRPELKERAHILALWIKHNPHLVLQPGTLEQGLALELQAAYMMGEDKMRNRAE